MEWRDNVSLHASLCRGGDLGRPLPQLEPCDRCSATNETRKDSCDACHLLRRSGALRVRDGAAVRPRASSYGPLPAESRRAFQQPPDHRNARTWFRRSGPRGERHPERRRPTRARARHRAAPVPARSGEPVPRHSHAAHGCEGLRLPSRRGAGRRSSRPLLAGGRSAPGRHGGLAGRAVRLRPRHRCRRRAGYASSCRSARARQSARRPVPRFRRARLGASGGLSRRVPGGRG